MRLGESVSIALSCPLGVSYTAKFLRQWGFEQLNTEEFVSKKEAELVLWDGQYTIVLRAKEFLSPTVTFTSANVTQVYEHLTQQGIKCRLVLEADSGEPEHVSFHAPDMSLRLECVSRHLSVPEAVLARCATSVQPRPVGARLGLLVPTDSPTAHAAFWSALGFLQQPAPVTQHAWTMMSDGVFSVLLTAASHWTCVQAVAPIEVEQLDKPVLLHLPKQPGPAVSRLLDADVTFARTFEHLEGLQAARLMIGDTPDNQCVGIALRVVHPKPRTGPTMTAAQQVWLIVCCGILVAFAWTLYSQPRPAA